MTPIPETPLPDPRLVPYTLTNNPLPDNLIPALSTYVMNLGHSLLSVEQRLAYLEEELAQTRAIHADLTLEKFKYASLTGMRAFPPEIVGHILRCALEVTSLEAPEVDEADPLEFIKLRLVCKEWNDIVIDTPDLWRKIKLDLDLWDLARSKELVSCVNLWLDRAGTANPPLSIAVVGGIKGHLHLQDKCKLAETIIAILFDPKRNWVKWRINSPSLLDVTSYFGGSFKAVYCEVAQGGRDPDLYPRTLAKLEQLAFGERSYGGALFRSAEMETFNVGSLLLTSPRHSQNPLQMPFLPTFNLCLPSALRFLHLRGSFIYSAKSIFEVATLEEVILEAHDQCKVQYSPSPVVSESIRRLILVGKGTGGCLSQLLQSVTLPSLDLFRLCSISNIGHWQMNTIAGFFSRSSPTRLCFSVEDCPGMRWCRTVLPWIAFGRVKRLYVDEIDSLCDEGQAVFTALSESVETIVCLNLPDVDRWKSISAPGFVGHTERQVTLYLPYTMSESPRILQDILDVRYASPGVLNGLVSHDIQGKYRYPSRMT